MKKPEQLSKRQHIKHINECATALWSKLNFEKGKWISCLKEALYQHRLYLIQCVEERKKIELEKIKRCDKCGIELNQDDIFHYVSYCHPCFKARYIDAVCIPRPRTKQTIEPRINHRLCL